MRLRQDDRAVLDLPLKLLITALVLAISIPAALTTMKKFARDDAEKEMETVVTRIQALAQILRSVAVGSSRDIHVDTAGNAFASIDNLTIGSNLSTNLAEGSIFTWKVDGRDRHSSHTPGEIFFQGETGGPAILLAKSYDLLLTHKTGPYGGRTDWHYVEVKVLR